MNDSPKLEPSKSFESKTQTFHGRIEAGRRTSKNGRVRSIADGRFANKTTDHLAPQCIEDKLS